MASICSKVLILFIWACMSTLSSANEGWFWGHNCTLPFKPRHNRSPPPPPRRLTSSPPPSRRLPSPPSQRHPPPTSRNPRTPPSQRLPPPPPSQQLPPPPGSRRPGKPPSQQLPPPPPLSPSSPPPPSQRPRVPPSPMMPPPPQSRRSRTPPSRQQSPPPPPLLSPPPPSPSLPPSPPPTPQSPRKIIVGGSEHWHLGFDYNDWALKNGPFNLNDILVFKYDPPSSSTPHSVYQLPNMRSFVNCDFGKAKMLANLTQGSGDGFEFVLKQQNPYYFACGEGNGFHCQSGSMKFTVTPIVQG